MNATAMSRGALLLLALAAARRCAAHWCSGTPLPKGEFRSDSDPLALVGRVETVGEAVESSDATAGLRFTVRLMGVRVERALKGAVAGPLVILRQPQDSEHHRLKAGEIWLFYLWKSREMPGLWEAHACSRTRRIEKAANDQQFLSALPESLQGP